MINTRKTSLVFCVLMMSLSFLYVFNQTALAGLIGEGFGGMLGNKEQTFLSTLTSAEAIWEADFGTTEDAGVEFWTDRTGNYTQDKLNESEQPTLTTSANFSNKSVLDFNIANLQSMDSGAFGDMTSKDMMTIFLVVEHDTASTTATLAEVANGTSANSVCNILTVSSGTIRARCKNSADAWISANWSTSTNFSATTLALIYDGRSGSGDISLYECNTQRANATDATGGFNTTSTSAWTMIAANDSYQADGKIAAYIIDDNAWTSQQLATAVAISREKYGVCN